MFYTDDSFWVAVIVSKGDYSKIRRANFQHVGDGDARKQVQKPYVMQLTGNCAKIAVNNQGERVPQTCSSRTISSPNQLQHAARG